MQPYGWLRAGLLGLVLAGASLPAAAAVVCTPSIGFTETFDAATQTGQYTISTGDLCGFQIIAAFVDNNSSIAAQSGRSGWGAEVISRETWNGVGNGTTEPTGPFLAFFDFGAPFFATGPTDVLFDNGLGPELVPTIGSFENFYGPGIEQVNMYYLTAHFGVPIGNFETEDQFFFSSAEPASDLTVVMLNGDELIVQQLTPLAVPAPAGLPLLALGLFGLAALRRQG
jgi:hypothetical protein